MFMVLPKDICHFPKAHHDADGMLYILPTSDKKKDGGFWLNPIYEGLRPTDIYPDVNDPLWQLIDWES
jgi:hypothetical protein